MNSLKRNAFALAALLVSGLPAWTVKAAPAQVPLFLGGSIEPNVMFTLDDSGSMHWEMMPDSLRYPYFIFPRQSNLYHSRDEYGNYVVSFDQTNNIYDKWIRSSAINKIYYNPTVTYRPWVNADGTLMAAASPSCAYHNPKKTSAGCRNLKATNSESAYWMEHNGTLANITSATVPRWSTTDSFWPALYYTFTGDVTSDTSIEDADNYERTEIKDNVNYTGSANRSDCAAAPSCTYDEEIQNFANWYTYYRSRILLARAGVGRAFAEQGAGLRVGFAAINKGSTTVDSVSSPGAVVNGVRKFSGSDRSAFFESLYTHEIPTSGTPLRRALDDVGQYFSRTDNSGPWGESPGSNIATAHLGCRQSYNILMTDGYWNSTAAPTSGAANADNVAGPTISGPDNQSYQYTPANPYQGLNADNSQQNNTLADVAMYYWNRDLRPDIDNLIKLPEDPVDPAFWQHLVNFTVGLGVEGTLDTATDLPLLTDGSKNWPAPSSTGLDENIDDLWHAAVNSRGGFFSASDPEEFATQFSSSLKQLLDRKGSAAAVATNSTRLNADTYVYQARFDSEGWRGELLGFKVDQKTGAIIDADTGTTELDPDWEAATLLDKDSALAHNNRNIFTHEAADSDDDGEVGVDFLWDDSHTPPTSLQTMIRNGDIEEIGKRRLGFVRGDRTFEIDKDPPGTFRKRTSVLGDIVNSDPFFVGSQDYGFNVLPGSEGSSYISYRSATAYKDRPGVVYVGANDGMLHAFRGDTGYELFAFIPEAVLPNLWELSDPNYSHRFYVDGPSSGKDAYIGSSWKSVLLGTTGAGGKSVFALDVTDPESFTKSNVMWEFSIDDDDADADGNQPGDGARDGDLGYTIGQPTVARMANGDWAAIFGNGYSSTNNRAALFIVDIATGNLIRKIDTEVGDSSNPNGLATPIVVDYNVDKIADRVYAGDLLGNMWAFDLSDTDTTKWDVDYQTNNLPAPLFTAEDASGTGTRQPITSKPEVTNHPSGGVLVLFGTGKYFESGDGAVKRKNSFYGIWDDFNESTPAPVSGGRNSLLQQVITHESFTDSSGGRWLSDGTTNTANPFTWDLRITTENSINWGTHKGWYIDLKSPLSFRDWEGERVVSAPLLRDGRVIFSTAIPSQDPCEYGGTSWLMELSSVDGSRLSVTPFDLNADGVFNESDYVTLVITDPHGNAKNVKIPTSGKKSKVGIIKTPAVIKTKDKEFKFTSGSSGDIEQTLESLSYRDGRQSWRQLR